ncbi:gamma-tubulin complex component 6 [Neocloeon triangulifer]|uniref:gamma-tubulin complex component 6 n=1 Tax=Neocloeon triangulifer TaxID=2078957 RepID=UPI00286FAC34|nr:gamma-tubulin complex component 6 [Neocloeon triangulifer]
MSLRAHAESQETLDILSQKSILELTKSLASCLTKKRKASDEAKITHLQVYEKLLSKRSNQDLYGDEILTMCIKNANHNEQTTNRLLSLIAQLSTVENGREIVQFLALMGRKVDKKDSPNESGKRKGVGIFHCPQEMLDGSLFSQPPCPGKDKEFYRSWKDFDFNAEPGTNLPTASKFLKLKKKEVVKTKEHKDLGYDSSEESEIDWEAVAKLGPPPRHRTWEQLGQIAPPPEKPHLTDISHIKPLKWQISRKEFVSHLGYLLIGIQSDSFYFCQERKSFALSNDVRVVGMSPQAIAEMVKPLIACGTSHLLLNYFVENTLERSRILQAVQKAVRTLLVVHRKCVSNLVSHHDDRVLALINSMHWIGPPVVAVSAFCCPASGKRLKGLAALEELSKICSEIIPGRTASVFNSLLKAAAEAYLRILWAWIFEGDLPQDKKSEFMIQSQPGVLLRRDRTFWADSFVVLENRVPSFLKGLETSIKQCGIALSFLKLYQNNHPLFKLKNRPPVVCCLNDAELARLETQCSLYEKEALEVCGAPVTAAEQLEINQEQQQAFLAMVARVREEKLVEIRATLKKEREEKAEKIRKLKQELMKQIEDAKARKADDLRKEREEEEKFGQELKELQEKQLKLLEEEKARMRRHYEMYSKVPEDKLATAEAEIQVLREELDNLNGSVRLEQQPEEPEQVIDNKAIEEDENKNPSSVSISGDQITEIESDTNANLSPRKVPTSLPLKYVHEEAEKVESPILDNTAAIEAAKNKAKVLSHEYNLIQNYDEVDSIQMSKKSVVTPDNQELGDMFKSRASEAARNKARVMHHEFFSDFDQIDNIKKEEVVLIDNKLQDASPVASEEMVSSSEMLLSTEEQNTPDSENQPSAMSISPEESTCPTPVELPSKPIPASASNFSVSSVLSAISEPLRWTHAVSRESINQSIKENSTDCSNYIKNSCLRQTASVVLNTQVRLANQYVLHIFLHDQSILSHFKSLRNFFLLLDGEFASRLTSNLCSDIEQFKDHPQSLLNFPSMNCILQNALVGSEDPNKERLSLSFRSVPQKFNVSDANLLGCIQLQYEVSWPLNSVLTRSVMQHYDQLFTFALSLRRVVWVLDQTFRHLKTCDAAVNKKVLNNSPQHRTLCLHLFEMSAFFKAFHSYILNVAVVQQWPKCEEAIKKVTNLDGLYEVHYKMFVKSVIYRCLLRKEAAQIQELLNATIRPVLRFYTLITAHEWQLKNGVYSHPQFKNLSQEHKKYHERTNLLAKNLSKLASRGYQSDLQDLCDYLRMNDFYSVLTVEPAQLHSMVSSTASSLASK